jgi:hypothetical protein
MTSIPTVQLGSLAALRIFGGFPSHRANTEDGLPVRSIGSLHEGSAPRMFATQDELSASRLGPAQLDDVLVTTEGVQEVGATWVVEQADGRFVPSRQTVTIRVENRNKIDPWYLAAFLASPIGQERIRALAVGTTIVRVPVDEMARLVLPLPDIDQQRRIAQRHRAFKQATTAHRAVATALEELHELDLKSAFATLADTPKDR